jgi:hypothetical protein
MAELVTQEEAEKIATEVAVEKPKKRRSTPSAIPRGLSEITGVEAIEVLEFLHRKYLSWLTEAEGAKYSTLYRQAKDEALKEAIGYYTEVQKLNKEIMDRLEQVTQTLQSLVSQLAPGKPVEQVVEETARKTVEQVRKSIFDDPRVRALLYVVYDYLADRDPRLRRYQRIVEAILLPETSEARREETSETTQEAT